MKLVKSVHINTFTPGCAVKADFTLGARVSVHLSLEDEAGRDVAYGVGIYNLAVGDHLAVMTQEEFLATPLGKCLLEQAVSNLLDEVARKAAALEGVKEAIAGGVL